MSSFATFVIHNARVFTADDALSEAEAVAVLGSLIIAVGDWHDVQPTIGPETIVLDGRGRTLMPGIIDSHFHLEMGARTLMGPQLYGVQTVEALGEAVQRWGREHPDAAWIIGQGGSYAIPSNEEPLTRHHLDQIEAKRPLVIFAYDMHSAFANTAALQAVGLWDTPPTAPMANGEVMLDADGRPTGELYEPDAMAYIYEAIPEPTGDERLAIIRQGLALMAEHGITSVHNMDGDVDQAAHYAMLEDQGHLTARVYVPFSVKPEHEVADMVREATALRTQFQSDMVRGGAVKFFMDGVYESYTAVTVEGYPDRPDHHGEPIWPAARFAEFATAADALGLQIFVHACGDGAVRRVLDGYEAAQRQNGVRDSRHRVEHIEMIAEADIGRFAELGVIASMQPLHAPLLEDDPDIWPSRVDPAAWDRAFAWRTLRDAGAVVAFGSDWPVVTLDPLLGIWGAVNRYPLGGKAADQRQTLAETLVSYTREAAYAEFQGHEKGQIKPGYLADLVLLSADIFTLPPEELNTVKVDWTMCDGRVVFERAPVESR